MNTAGALALILMIYSAFETSSSLFKYLFQFLVAFRPLIGLNISVSTENLSTKSQLYFGSSKILQSISNLKEFASQFNQRIDHSLCKCIFQHCCEDAAQKLATVQGLMTLILNSTSFWGSCSSLALLGGSASPSNVTRFYFVLIVTFKECFGCLPLSTPSPNTLLMWKKIQINIYQLNKPTEFSQILFNVEMNILEIANQTIGNGHLDCFPQVDTHDTITILV